MGRKEEGQMVEIRSVSHVFMAPWHANHHYVITAGSLMPTFSHGRGRVGEEEDGYGKEMNGQHSVKSRVWNKNEVQFRGAGGIL